MCVCVCVCVCVLKTLKWTQQASWQEVRLRSLPQRMTQAKGEKKNKAARASKSFCKALQSFPGFSGKRKKRKERAGRGLVNSWLQKCWWVGLCWFCFSKLGVRKEGVLGLALLAGRAVFLISVLTLLFQPLEESWGLLPHVSHWKADADYLPKTSKACGRAERTKFCFILFCF